MTRADRPVRGYCRRDCKGQLCLRARADVGGGHSDPGLGTCDDGLVIDPAGMKGIAYEVRPTTADDALDNAHLSHQWGNLASAQHERYCIQLPFAEVIVGVDPDLANNERMVGWARDYWMALHPYSAGVGYVNMMMDEGTDKVKAAYRDNYTRDWHRSKQRMIPAICSM